MRDCPITDLCSVAVVNEKSLKSESDSAPKKDLGPEKVIANSRRPDALEPRVLGAPEGYLKKLSFENRQLTLHVAKPNCNFWS